MKNAIAIFTVLMLSLAASAQGVVLRGQVRSDGRGVPYATLQLRGTSIGVCCNDAGEYELKIPAGHEADSIVVRSMGYDSRTLPLAQLLKNGNVKLTPHTFELQEVAVNSFRDARQLLEIVLLKLEQNYHQQTAWSTFFYRNWRALDGELYLFDEAVLSVERAPYEQYAEKRSYAFRSSQREMESNIKTLLRHRLLVCDRQQLEDNIVKKLGCDQMLVYSDNEDFFDPVSTPQASFPFAKTMLRNHNFQPLREFTSDGEDYYFVRGYLPKAHLRHDYTIRKRDHAIVRLVSVRSSYKSVAPEEAWVNPWFTSLVFETDSSVFDYDIREGRYTLTRYYNYSAYRLESHGRGHDGEEQRWQRSVDWILTDFSLSPPEVEGHAVDVQPRTIDNAFGSSDYDAGFWGHYNIIAVDSIPLQLLRNKLLKR